MVCRYKKTFKSFLGQGLRDIQKRKIVTSAVLSSIYKSDAVLTGVKTDEKFRRQGFAGEAVKYLCSCVSGSVYLMREDGKNENFYSEIGFKNIERWRMYR